MCTPYPLCAYYNRKKMYAQRVSTIEWKWVSNSQMHSIKELYLSAKNFILKETTHNDGNLCSI